MNTITKNLQDNPAPLYHQYPGQCQPQPAYIELDCRGAGELMADWNGEIGNAIPMYYWNGLAVRWGISCAAAGGSIAALFEDADFLACCERIMAGFEEHWDGSNFVGRYTDDANSAIVDAERIIDSMIDCCEVWPVSDYLFTSCELVDFWNDNSLDDAVISIKTGIDSNMVVVGDIEQALVDRALSDLDYFPERLNRNHIKTLWQHGKITRSDVKDWLR